MVAGETRQRKIVDGDDCDDCDDCDKDATKGAVRPFKAEGCRFFAWRRGSRWMLVILS